MEADDDPVLRVQGLGVASASESDMHVADPAECERGCEVRDLGGVSGGGALQAKSWLATDAEPGAWDVSGTTTRTAAGHLGFWAGCDAAAASQIALFDDITITTA